MNGLRILLGALVMLVVAPSTHAEAVYSLERCVAREHDLSLRFIGARGEVRRMNIGRSGIELSGDVKGASQLAGVRELSLNPALTVYYVSGTSVKFGPVTAACKARVLKIAKQLALPVRGTDG